LGGGIAKNGGENKKTGRIETKKNINTLKNGKKMECEKSEACSFK
jgi:hypothetical protein